MVKILTLGLTRAYKAVYFILFNVWDSTRRISRDKFICNMSIVCTYPGKAHVLCATPRERFNDAKNFRHHSTMGWFARSSKAEDISEPSRQNRQKCWEARDLYFNCLDRLNIIKAGDEGSACSKEKILYEGECAKSWVRLGRALVYIAAHICTHIPRLYTSTSAESLPTHKRIVSLRRNSSQRTPSSSRV